MWLPHGKVLTGQHRRPLVLPGAELLAGHLEFAQHQAAAGLDPEQIPEAGPSGILAARFADVQADQAELPGEVYDEGLQLGLGHAASFPPGGW